MLDTNRIVKVYSGRKGCMCGCNGKYSYTAHGAVNNSPGYDVTDRVNERSVKIIAKKVMLNPAVQYEEDYAFVETDARIQVVFFN
jgi:hypothetical protein